jgi:hypothetical protein
MKKSAQALSLQTLHEFSLSVSGVILKLAWHNRATGLDRTIVQVIGHFD